MVQVTNALFDARIASEVAPIARASTPGGDIDTYFPVADNTEQIKVECVTTVGGNTLFISYEELLEDDLWADMVAVADGFDTVVNNINVVLTSTKAFIDGLSEPFTYEEYREVIERLQVPPMYPLWGH